MERFYWHAPSQQDERSWLRVAIALALGLMCAAFSGPARAAGKYALVIGVEHYIPDQLSQLNYAEDDAVALGEALGKLGFEVITMTSQSVNPRHKPSNAKKIETQIRQRLTDRNAHAPMISVTLAKAADQSTHACRKDTITSRTLVQLPPASRCLQQAP